MTLHDILNASKTSLYLTGKDAYIREYDITTHAKKSDFSRLLNNRQDVVVFVSKSTAEKYAKAINRLGFVLSGKADYDIYSYALYYKKFKCSLPA